MPHLEKLRWLIVEDSLQTREGHWLEYIEAFHQGLARLGDSLTLLASRKAEPFIQNHFGALPLLPESICHKMSDGAGPLRRYARIPIHACQTWFALRRFLGKETDWDIIFVPTVTVHHLLAWVWLIKGILRRKKTRIVLYFVGLPIRLQAVTSEVVLDGSPTSRLLGLLLRSLEREVRNGRVILGVETLAMQRAAGRAFGMPFVYFAQPVTPVDEDLPRLGQTGGGGDLLMACYGPARHEKGSDVLLQAIERYLAAFPDTRVRFAIQWLDDFTAGGRIVRLPQALRAHPRVEIIDRFFGDGEYAVRLRKTDVMLLPYRLSSYALRGSRVAIEAMVNGIPAVATNGTTFASQAAEFGAVVGCEDGSAESLCAAIETAERNYPELRARALERMPKAREHFSVRNFRSLLPAKTNRGSISPITICA